MTIIPQCLECVHITARRGDGMTCEAFPAPGRIPNAILLNEHDHREPFEGDHGVRFEAKAERVKAGKGSP